MRTLLTTSPDVAAAFVRSGEIAAFPTETVYGLGADAFDVGAVERIFEAKGRPVDNPLIVHLGDIDQLSMVSESVPDSARELISHFFPGPLTVILPRIASLPKVVTAGLETVGVRMPAHPVAQAFLSACGRPVAAPSANRSGRPSPTSWEAVEADLDGRIPCILQGERTDVGLESTVVDCTATDAVVLRAGAVSLEQLRMVLPTVRFAGEEDVLARSPGTRYRHYAPRARIHIVDDPREAPSGPRSAFIGVTPPPDPDSFGLVELCADVPQYARELFHFFRRCDAAGIERVFCEAVAPDGLGLALMDRLRRGAAG